VPTPYTPEPKYAMLRYFSRICFFVYLRSSAIA